MRTPTGLPRFRKNLAICVLCLATSVLGGCVVLQAGTALTNAGAAYFSYKAANRPVYVAGCEIIKPIYPSEEAIAAMTEEDKDQIIGHNVALDALCEDNDG